MMPRLFAQRFLLRLCFLLLVFLPVCGTSPVSPCRAAETPTSAPALEDEYGLAEKLLKELQASRRGPEVREDWLTVYARLLRVYQVAPPQLAARCLWQMATLNRDLYLRYRNQVDLDRALVAYRDLANLYPRDLRADNALYTAARLYSSEKKDPELATAYLKRIVAHYPAGDMVERARRDLALAETQPSQGKETAAGRTEYRSPVQAAMTENHAAPSTISAVQVWTTPYYARIVIRGSAETGYASRLKPAEGAQPARLTVDLENSVLGKQLGIKTPPAEGPLASIRPTQTSPSTTRLSLDLREVSRHKVFSLSDPFRIVIDVQGKTPPATEPAPVKTPVVTAKNLPPVAVPPPVQPPAATAAMPGKTPAAKAPAVVAKTAPPPAPLEPPPVAPAVVARTAPVPPPETATPAVAPVTPPAAVVARIERTAPPEEKTRTSQEAPTEIPVLGPGQRVKKKAAVSVAGALSLAKQLGLNVGRVVLDPGHGGHDPGAIGHGLKEKDVVLKIARKAATILSEEHGIEVVMTRDTDVFIPLEERTAIANTSRADLFVSVHTNAASNQKAQGLETYFLNLASDESAMRLAAYENATSTHKLSELQDILAGLLNNNKKQESAGLARNIQDTVTSLLKDKGLGGVKDLGVKQAPFYVLIGAEMPAVLVECLFLSNADDAALLKDDAKLDLMAESLATGVSRYVKSIKHDSRSAAARPVTPPAPAKTPAL